MNPIMIEMFKQLGFEHNVLHRSLHNKNQMTHVFINTKHPQLEAVISIPVAGPTVVTLLHAGQPYCSTLLSVLTFKTVGDWIQTGGH